MIDSFRSLFFGPELVVWVQQTLGLGWPLPFRALSLLGISWGVIAVLGIAFWLWGREEVYALGGILVLEAISNMVINQLGSVPRPSAPEIVIYEQISLPSFPSGHVFTATILWGLLWARGRIPLWLAGAVVFLVALSRLYLGTHYLGDVIGGALFGTLLVWGFRHLWPPVRRWLAERSGHFFTGLAVLALAGAALVFLLLERSPFVWNSAALGAGAAVALWAEHRFVRYRPRGRMAALAGVGVAGLLPLLLVDRLTGDEPLALGAATAFLAIFWVLLGAPALFARTQRNRGRQSGGAAAP